MIHDAGKRWHVRCNCRVRIPTSARDNRVVHTQGTAHVCKHGSRHGIIAVRPHFHEHSGVSGSRKHNVGQVGPVLANNDVCRAHGCTHDRERARRINKGHVPAVGTHNGINISHVA